MPRTNTSHPRRGAGFVAGGLVVAVLVAAGIAVSIGAAVSGRSPAGAGPTPTAPRQAVDGGSICGLPGRDVAGATLTAAPATSWSTVGTMDAPTSTTAGPGRQETDGVRSCYAHTVNGALFAVGNFWATGSDPRLYRQIVTTNIATGTGRDAALRRPGTRANTGASAQIAAFRVVSYRPTTATIDVALASSDGRDIGFPVPLVWQDGDWKVQLADDGSNVFTPTLLPSLAGYIAWAGNE